MGNLNLFDVIQDAAETSPTLGTGEAALTDFDAQGNLVERDASDGLLSETPPTLADVYAGQEEPDPAEEAEAYGAAGPPIPEDSDPYYDEDIPDEICACMMVDDWARQEDDDEPEGPPNPGKKPADSGIRVVRNGTNTYLDDGEHTYHPNWPEIRAKMGVSENPREVKAFFDKTLPAMSDAELVALVEEA